MSDSPIAKLFRQPTIVTAWYEYRLKSLVKCVEDLDAAKAPVVKAHAE